MAAMANVSFLRAATVRLHPDDDVVIAVHDLAAGTVLPDAGVTVAAAVPAGHKVATRAVAAGGAVHRYAQMIGFASAPIAAGDHVHTHNLAMGAVQRDHAHGSAYVPTASNPSRPRSWASAAPDGRVATRNHLAVIATVNCSATVARHDRRARAAQRRARRLSRTSTAWWP